MDNPALIPILFIALVIGGFVIWYRWLQPRVDQSLSAVAAALSLPAQATPDTRTRLYAGRVLDLRVDAASHPDLQFVLGDGALQHSGSPALGLRVLLAEPLAPIFRLDTSRSGGCFRPRRRTRRGRPAPRLRAVRTRRSSHRR